MKTIWKLMERVLSTLRRARAAPPGKDSPPDDSRSARNMAATWSFLVFSALFLGMLYAIAQFFGGYTVFVVVFVAVSSYPMFRIGRSLMSSGHYGTVNSFFWLGTILVSGYVCAYAAALSRYALPLSLETLMGFAVVNVVFATIAYVVWRFVYSLNWFPTIPRVHIGVMTYFGTRYTEIARVHKGADEHVSWYQRLAIKLTPKVFGEGLHFIPWPFGFIDVNRSQTEHDRSLEVITPDNVSSRVKFQFLVRPSMRFPENFLEISGGMPEVLRILDQFIESKLVPWVTSEEDGPMTWKRLREQSDEVTDIAVEHLIELYYPKYGPEWEGEENIKCAMEECVSRVKLSKGVELEYLGIELVKLVAGEIIVDKRVLDAETQLAIEEAQQRSEVVQTETVRKRTLMAMGEEGSNPKDVLSDPNKRESYKELFGLHTTEDLVREGHGRAMLISGGSGAVNMPEAILAGLDRLADSKDSG